MLSTLLLVVLFLTAWASCPDGTDFQPYFNKCYNVNSHYLSFPAAEQACNKLGGNLISPENMFETVYVSGIATASTPAPSFWIGANYLMDPQWTWTTGEPVAFTNWAPNQPNDPSAYECAAVREQDNMWIKKQCNSRRPSVCQIDPNTSLSPSPTPTWNNTCPANAVCSSGYTLYIETCKCYKVVISSPVSFTDAQALCAQENGFLPKIPDNSTNKFLYTLVNYQYDWVWTGLNCPNGRDSCQWQDGTPLGSFRPFYDTESGVSYYLITAARNRAAKKWTYLSPSDTYYVICQKGISNSAYCDYDSPRFHNNDCSKQQWKLSLLRSIKSARKKK